MQQEISMKNSYDISHAVYRLVLLHDQKPDPQGAALTLIYLKVLL